MPYFAFEDNATSLAASARKITSETAQNKPKQRKNSTIHRLFERRNWRPLSYYLQDTCMVNSYLI
jgi:hypothetical protein